MLEVEAGRTRINFPEESLAEAQGRTTLALAALGEANMVAPSLADEQPPQALSLDLDLMRRGEAHLSRMQMLAHQELALLSSASTPANKVLSGGASHASEELVTELFAEAATVKDLVADSMREVEAGKMRIEVLEESLAVAQSRATPASAASSETKRATPDERRGLQVDSMQESMGEVREVFAGMASEIDERKKRISELETKVAILEQQGGSFPDATRRAEDACLLQMQRLSQLELARLGAAETAMAASGPTEIQPSSAEQRVVQLLEDVEMLRGLMSQSLHEAQAAKGKVTELEASLRQARTDVGAMGGPPVVDMRVPPAEDLSYSEERHFMRMKVLAAQEKASLQNRLVMKACDANVFMQFLL